MSSGLSYKIVAITLLVFAVAHWFVIAPPGTAYASEYSDCIAACGGQVSGGCNNSQIEYCRSLPSADSGGVDEPGSVTDPGPTIGLTNQLSFDSIEELLDEIADILFTYSIPLLVIMIIIGAFYLLTAGGNPERIKTGKKIITWAIIGFVVILIAGSIASLIRNLLEG